VEAARPATLEDVDLLVALARACAEELASQRGGELLLERESRRDPPGPALVASIADPEQHVSVGTVDGAVVGYGVVRAEVMGTGRVVAIVDDIFVHPGARGIGVGEAIMDQLVMWSSERGAIGIDSVVLPGMRDSKNFFETCGLVARAIVVHRPLDDAPPDAREP